MSNGPQVPRFDELMWPALQTLKRIGGAASHRELLEKVIALLKIQEQVLTASAAGGRESRVSYNLRWAESYLRLYGALENTARGVLALTPRGRQLREGDMKEVVSAVKKMSRAKHAAQNGEPEKEEPPEPLTGWKDQLLAVLQGMKADAFERLCQRILRESGFLNVEVTGRTGDGGVDGVGVLRLKLLSFRVCFQCKKWKGTVGPNQIRDFRGAMDGRTDKGLFITTGTYTPDALREATRAGALAIDLIDGEQLCDLLKELNLGVATARKQVEEITVDPDWFAQI